MAKQKNRVKKSRKQLSSERRIGWSVKSVVPLVLGVIIIVLLVMMVVSVAGKRMRLNAEVVATRMEVTTQLATKESGQQMVYAPNYYYEVNGEEYVCRGAGQEREEDIPKEMVRVYYVQDKPAECLTEGQMELASSELWWVIGMGLAMLSTGVWAILVGVYNLRHSEAGGGIDWFV